MSAWNLPLWSTPTIIFLWLGNVPFFKYMWALNILEEQKWWLYLMAGLQRGDFWQQRLCPAFTPAEEAPTSTLSVLGVTDYLWYKVNMKPSKCILCPRKRMICVLFPWLSMKKNYIFTKMFSAWQLTCPSLGLRCVGWRSCHLQRHCQDRSYHPSKPFGSA